MVEYIAEDARSCTCHPDDDAIIPCRKRFAYSECVLVVKIDKQREIIERLLVAGNHIATHRTDRWPDYRLDGLDRREQCEHALRILGATRDYDMWCCWSAMMQARDEYVAMN